MAQGQATQEEVGKALNSLEIQRGLRELNPDISFDAPINRPSEYRFPFKPATLAGIEAQRNGQCGIYWNGKYVGSMDRGPTVPEHSVWSLKKGVEEIRMADIMRYDDTKVAYKEIKPNHENYDEAVLKVERGDDNFTKTSDGKIFYYQPLRVTMVRDRIVKLGWRSTFNRLLGAGIPNLTPRSLAEKFGD